MKQYGSMLGNSFMRESQVNCLKIAADLLCRTELFFLNTSLVYPVEATELTSERDIFLYSPALSICQLTQTLLLQVFPVSSWLVLRCIFVLHSCYQHIPKNQDEIRICHIIISITASIRYVLHLTNITLLTKQI